MNPNRDEGPLLLAGDIGGTKTDLAVVSLARGPREALAKRRYPSADFAGLAPSVLQQALVTEYTHGAAIGWHRDRPAYRDVIGVSLSSSCRFRFRRKRGSSWWRTHPWSGVAASAFM